MDSGSLSPRGTVPLVNSSSKVSLDLGPHYLCNLSMSDTEEIQTHIDLVQTKFENQNHTIRLTPVMDDDVLTVRIRKSKQMNGLYAPVVDARLGPPSTDKSPNPPQPLLVTRKKDFLHPFTFVDTSALERNVVSARVPEDRHQGTRNKTTIKTTEMYDKGVKRKKVDSLKDAVGKLLDKMIK